MPQKKWSTEFGAVQLHLQGEGEDGGKDATAGQAKKLNLKKKYFAIMKGSLDEKLLSYGVLTIRENSRNNQREQ